MNEEDTSKKLDFVRKRIENAELRRIICGLMCLFVVGGAAFLFFSMISGPGAGPDRMFDGMALIPVLMIGALGGLIAGLVWTFSWFQLKSLRSEYAKLEVNTAVPSEPRQPLLRGELRWGSGGNF